jgi:hypothetical protein
LARIPACLFKNITVLVIADDRPRKPHFPQRTADVFDRRARLMPKAGRVDLQNHTPRAATTHQQPPPSGGRGRSRSPRSHGQRRGYYGSLSCRNAGTARRISWSDPPALVHRGCGMRPTGCRCGVRQARRPAPTARSVDPRRGRHNSPRPGSHEHVQSPTRSAGSDRGDDRAAVHRNAVEIKAVAASAGRHAYDRRAGLKTRRWWACNIAIVISS